MSILIYFTIIKSQSEDLEAVKAEKIDLANQINDRNSIDLKNKEEALRLSIRQLEIKEKNLRDSLNLRFIEDLLILENKLKDVKLYIDEYRKGYANSRIRDHATEESIAQFVAGEKRSDFNLWFYTELNRAIDRSNERALDQIELQRKISEYSIK